MYRNQQSECELVKFLQESKDSQDSMAVDPFLEIDPDQQGGKSVLEIYATLN